MNLPQSSHYITDSKSRQEQYDIIQNYIKKHYPNVKGTCYSGYCGRQVEEYWYDEFHNKSIDEFGVFVPIVIKYVNLFFNKGRGAYYRFVKGLWKLINKDFLYITLSSLDEGLETSKNIKVPENVLILAPGGIGHIPINLFLQDYNIVNPNPNPNYTAVFMGRFGTHPVRKEMVKIATKKLGNKFYCGQTNNKNWIEIYKNSKAVLCPRGNGRNSFRLTETLQMGLIPIYIYNDVPWVPYYDSIGWSNFGFVTRNDGLEKVLDKIDKMNQSDLESMRKRIREMYYTHFTVNGTMKQIQNFLKYGFDGTDLKCAARTYKKDIL
ncbi:Exostosin family protein [Histomonas meleagridis]|uniref:Exostosin family protein n=1 Tax=Histomonas meleagridis TaxID=135588 RepID=UPI0035598BBE|nr:Exostosin family protein [Histomonas meleagridis]KAH0805257.1 Exostosin family protein [Histomonas meleagridis]